MIHDREDPRAEQAFNTFFKLRIGPAVQEVGIQGQPDVKFYPTHGVVAPALRKNEQTSDIQVWQGWLAGHGAQDPAGANSSSNNVTVLRNNGAGTIQEATSSPEAMGAAPYSLGAEDLDGDQDIATANAGSNNVTILENR